MDVYVVDPHPIYRRGAAAGLRMLPEVATVTEADDVEHAEADAALARADVLVLDREACGATDLHARLAERGGPRVVLCAWSWTADSVRVAMRHGAAGVLLKGSLAPASLGSAVRAAVRGGAVLAPELLERLVDGAAPPPLPERRAAERLSLTPRERRVLRLIAEGLPTREVAQELSYSERTVKNVVHDAVMKLGARSRSQAVASALRSGLI